jgi:hypothetical protein
MVMLMKEYDLGNKTIREVVTEFVLPETREYGVSMAGVMKKYYHDYIGRAGFYVSFPWDSNFGRLVTALSGTYSTTFFCRFFVLLFFAFVFSLLSANEIQTI